MSEELAQTSTHSGGQQNSTTVKQQRSNPQECRNQDLVSRLLAATPPYFYSAPMAPHNFFFSEMLRSLVQSKSNEAATTRINQQQQPQQQPQVGRRPRKRSWSQHRPSIYENLPKDIEEKISDKPLELTNKPSAFTLTSKTRAEEKENSNKILRTEVDINNKLKETESAQRQTPTQILTEPPTAAIPPSDLILPPPPPMWYPPLYPPYGIDPLHFFIDLRVSGHIYDRKKDNISPTFKSDLSLPICPDVLGKERQGSAFTVPAPRENKTTMHLENTTMNLNEVNANFSKNTNYVMQNLPKIYTNLKENHSISMDVKHQDDDREYEIIEDKNCHSINLSGLGNVDSSINECIRQKDNNFKSETDDEPIAVDELD